MGTKSFRSDDQLNQELQYIQSTLRVSQTQVIREAIHSYYESVQKKERQHSPLEVLKRSGFIGCVESDETDVSTTYKKRMTKSIKDKYGIKD